MGMVGYTDRCNCQNSMKVHLRIAPFILCKFYTKRKNVNKYSTLVNDMHGRCLGKMHWCLYLHLKGSKKMKNVGIAKWIYVR